MRMAALPIFGFMLMALLQLGSAQVTAPSPAAPAPSNDGVAIDQGISYVLLMLALARDQSRNIMEANKWFRSFSTGGRNIQLGRHYGEDEASKKGSIWKIPSYDEYTYSQNFDKGSNWDEPDQLLRSFSVRYADRSRMMIFK
nr:putative arabinogalactan peptide, AGP [Ipomoea batatas]